MHSIDSCLLGSQEPLQSSLLGSVAPHFLAILNNQKENHINNHHQELITQKFFFYIKWRVSVFGVGERKEGCFYRC